MLEHLFGSKTRVKLLQIFFKQPERHFYFRELARLADIQLNAVRREIQNLMELGIIKPSDRVPGALNDLGTERSKYFCLDLGGLLFTELKALLLKAKILDEQHFIDEVKKRAGTLKLFLLTGIFTEDKNAEIDMLLVGSVKERSLMLLVKEFEKTMGESLRYTVMTESEFAERREIGDKFLYGVLEAKCVYIADEYRLG